MAPQDTHSYTPFCHWGGHLSHHISKIFYAPFRQYRIWGASAQINKWIRYYLPVSCIVPLFFSTGCHLENHKAHEHGKQKLLSVRIWLCVLNELHPLIWAQQKLPSIGPLIVRLSAHLSSPSSHLPSPILPPPLHPSSLLPAQGLIDQLCPGSCPLISQLDVFCVWVKWINYWANRTGSVGPREPMLGPWMWCTEGQSGWERMKLRYGSVRGEMKQKAREARRKTTRVANWLRSQRDQRNGTQKGGKWRNIG